MWLTNQLSSMKLCAIRCSIRFLFLAHQSDDLFRCLPRLAKCGTPNTSLASIAATRWPVKTISSVTCNRIANLTIIIYSRPSVSSAAAQY